MRATFPRVYLEHIDTFLQTEELLVKRRNLLEKKVDQETERAKEFTRLKNKRGEFDAAGDGITAVSSAQPGSAGCSMQHMPDRVWDCGPQLTSGLCYVAALQALKKRKLYESQLESVENNIMRVNEQQMMLENQRTTVETVSALSNAAKASKQTMHEMKVLPRCTLLSTTLLPSNDPSSPPVCHRICSCVAAANTVANEHITRLITQIAMASLG